MKLIRSTKCTLKFATQAKQACLQNVLVEYGRVTNFFIDLFWENPIEKGALLKGVVNLPSSWLSARLRKVAAREALDMISSAKERWKDKAIKPTHCCTRMCVSSTIAGLVLSKTADSFDAWLQLRCIGSDVCLDLPIKFHKHLHGLVEDHGVRKASYVITKDYVQLAYEFRTEPKLVPTRCVGIDTGIKSLATFSTGEKLGTDIGPAIDRIKRCKHGSVGQRRATRALKQKIDEVAKEAVTKGTLLVVEDLKNITQKTKVKRRLTRNMRRSVGRWNVRYWQCRLEYACERNRVSLRRVPAYWTSTTCPCGYTDRRNRVGTEFLCLSCGYQADADVNAARNIVNRFITGPYGAGCKAVPWLA